MDPTGELVLYPFPGFEGCVQTQDWVWMGTQDEVVGVVLVVLVDEVVVVQVWLKEELALLDMKI